MVYAHPTTGARIACIDTTSCSADGRRLSLTPAVGGYDDVAGATNETTAADESSDVSPSVVATSAVRETTASLALLLVLVLS